MIETIYYPKIGLIGTICELFTKDLAEKTKARIGNCSILYTPMKRLKLEGMQIKCY
jgi:hypothetical protein